MSYGPEEKATLTQKWDYFFPLPLFSSCFDSTVIEGPVQCHKLTHGYKHLFISQQLTEFPSLGKTSGTRELKTAEGGPNPTWVARWHRKKKN